MKKTLKYIVMTCFGVLLSMVYLRIADAFIRFISSGEISFSDQGVQFLIVIIIYITVIFPGILILLNAISKRW